MRSGHIRWVYDASIITIETMINRKLLISARRPVKAGGLKAEGAGVEQNLVSAEYPLPSRSTGNRSQAVILDWSYTYIRWRYGIPC